VSVSDLVYSREPDLRVADALARLGSLHAQRAELDAAERELVASLRSMRASWADIGSVLGVSKQVACYRFGRSEA
jgi:hypothetical protein